MQVVEAVDPKEIRTKEVDDRGAEEHAGAQLAQDRRLPDPHGEDARELGHDEDDGDNDKQLQHMERLPTVFGCDEWVGHHFAQVTMRALACFAITRS